MHDVGDRTAAGPTSCPPWRRLALAGRPTPGRRRLRRLTLSRLAKPGQERQHVQGNSGVQGTSDPEALARDPQRLRAQMGAFTDRYRSAVLSQCARLRQLARQLLAPLNRAARRAVVAAAAELMALSLALQEEYAASGEVIIALVYRMEAADARLASAIAAAWPTGPEQPARAIHHMATALHEVVHLAQLAREWRQDAINLRHSLALEDAAEGAPDEGRAARQAAIAAGIARLDDYVRQNMDDLDRWLKAAAELNPRAFRAATDPRRDRL